MLTKKTWTEGLKNGIKTTWILGKVVFPVTVIVTVLKYTPVIDVIIQLFTPLMGWLGLPGEAAIPLVLGNVLNLYAAIGAILSLDLSVKSVFILAVMLSFSHNLIIETAVAKQIGIKAIYPVAIRLGLAFLSAFVIHHVWKGGAEIAQYGMIAAAQQDPDSWMAIGGLALKTALIGIWQIAVIVLPLMVGIQILKDVHAIEAMSKWLYPLTKMLGLSTGKTSIPLLAGIIFGLAYGAGVIIQSAREENFSKKDLYLLTTFLVSSHAVIEDTMIFIPLGIPVIPLLLIRVITALILTLITARLWQRFIPYSELSTKGVAK